MKLIIIALAHGDPYWWNKLQAAQTLPLDLGTSPPFDPGEFPPTITLTKRVVQSGAHQLVHWTYPQFHRPADEPVHVEIAEIERRAVLIYQAVWNHTGCLANDAIIVHGTSFPNSVVDPAYTRYARYVYGGAVDDFARAAYEGRISNDVFSAFVNEYLRKQISLDTFRDRYPGLV